MPIQEMTVIIARDTEDAQILALLHKNPQPGPCPWDFGVTIFMYNFERVYQQVTNSKKANTLHTPRHTIHTLGSSS